MTLSFCLGSEAESVENVAQGAQLDGARSQFMLHVVEQLLRQQTRDYNLLQRKLSPRSGLVASTVSISRSPSTLASLALVAIFNRNLSYLRCPVARGESGTATSQYIEKSHPIDCCYLVRIEVVLALPHTARTLHARENKDVSPLLC